MNIINRKSNTPTANYPDTIVSSGMRIEGELKSSGSIKIDGVVSGKVHTAQNLDIGPNAQVDADVIAQNAVIGGVVAGSVNIKNSLQILSTGKILGNITCVSLGIEPGGYFNGNCKMLEAKNQVQVKTEE